MIFRRHLNGAGQEKRELTSFVLPSPFRFLKSSKRLMLGVFKRKILLNDIDFSKIQKRFACEHTPGVECFSPWGFKVRYVFQFVHSNNVSEISTAELHYVISRFEKTL